MIFTAFSVPTRLGVILPPATLYITCVLRIGSSRYLFHLSVYVLMLESISSNEAASSFFRESLLDITAGKVSLTLAASSKSYKITSSSAPFSNIGIRERTATSITIPKKRHAFSSLWLLSFF